MKSSGDEGAAYTEAALRSGLFPDGLQVNANGRKNGDVQDCKKIVWKLLGGVEFHGDTAEAKIDYAGAAETLVA